MRRLLVLSALAICGCVPIQAPPPRAVEVGEDRRECPRVAYFEEEDELRAQLPRLYEQHQRELIVLGTAVYLNRCAQSSRLAGAGEGSRLAGAGEGSRVAGAGEGSRVAGAGEGSRVAGAGEGSRVAGAGEGSRVAGAGEDSRVAGAGEDSRVAGAGEGSRVAGAGEDSRVAGAGEGSRVAGAGEGSRLAGASRPLTCTIEGNALGYEIHPRVDVTVRIYDGIALWRIEGDELVPE